jgi:hypothetical protein
LKKNQFKSEKINQTNEVRIQGKELLSGLFAFKGKVRQVKMKKNGG